ncbi:MAG TPA: 50S ribosomal protein L4 [Phycisphaerae bacterium]|nr:50S ribosomal protein L4 [Phycisphaerae bacterium]
MIEIPVLDTKGQKIGAEQLDPARFGDRVRYELLKQAVVAYRANKRQGTVRTKSRGMVDGSTRKLYRQKGTGRARMGNVRTPVRVGGGHAFAKINRDFSQKLPRKMRRLARDSAILAKAMSGTALIVSGIKLDAPKTAQLAGILRATDTDGGALLAVAGEDRNLLLSGRNIPDFAMKQVSELNAHDVLRARKLVFTPEAFRALTSESQPTGDSREA